MALVLFNLTGCKLFECTFTQHFKLKLFQNHYFKMATVLPMSATSSHGSPAAQESSPQATSGVTSNSQRGREAISALQMQS